MFFGGDRIDFVREMILADTAEERQKAVDKLFPFQKEDFIGIFREMGHRPVTIRTLDPPLHEFLPHGETELRELAERLGKSYEEVRAKVESLHEFNPMMGHRGCRLGIVYPEITRMQARAIFSAAAEIKKTGTEVFPEVMIPLVSDYRELMDQASVVHEAAEEIKNETVVEFKYLVGTMIEVPRAAICADEIAGHADFFSFGTNDLTQLTMGLSRDDSGKFLPYYIDREIYKTDPFITLDHGVGELVKMAIRKGKAVKHSLKIGICGEHGGDPATIDFCNSAGMDYVSCSPYRIPVARIAAAQSEIRKSKHVIRSVKKKKK